VKFSLFKPAPPDPPGVTIPAWLPVQLKALSWIATAGVFYMLWLFSLSAAKDAAAALQITHAGTWVGNIAYYFPVIVGYLLIAWVVAWTGKVAVAAFVSFRWRISPWPKGWTLFILLSVSAVIITGSIAVQTETRFEANRGAAVAVEKVGAGRAALEAQREQLQLELKQMLENRNAYLAQAANVGEKEWQLNYINPLSKTDPQRDRIIRALGAARTADEKRREIKALTIAIAQAPTTASVAKRVTVGDADTAMARFVDWLGSIRSILLAVLQDIACLLLPWIAMRTEQERARQLEECRTIVATIDPSHLLAHFEEEVEAQPYEDAVKRTRTETIVEPALKRGTESDKPVPHSASDERVVRSPNTEETETTEVTMEQAEALVSSGTHEWVEEDGKRHIRKIEGGARLPNNEGIMLN